MHLDCRETYLKELKLLKRLPLPKLKALSAELYEIRYVDQDIEVDAYYRLVAYVLLEKTRVSKRLTFHLKNFMGLLLVSILIRIFNYH